MRGKKLTPEERRTKRVNQALKSIRKLERCYEQTILQKACNKYSILLREKRNALTRKKQLEEELERLKGKI